MNITQTLQEKGTAMLTSKAGERTLAESLPSPPAGRSGWPWEGELTRPPVYDPAMAWPKISIVTPSFNQGHFLEETIRSVLLQGYPNLEYYVMDGGSTDDSVAVIRKYEPWLNGWVSGKDRGQSHAINNGFAQCSGDIYAYINSDDLLEAGALQAVAKEFLAGAQWVVGPVRMFQEGKEDSLHHASVETSPDEMLWMIHFTQQGSFWAGDLFRRFGNFREELRYVFDYEYWMRLRIVGGIKPLVIPRVLAAYRWHAASKSMSESSGFRVEGKRMRAEYRAKLPLGRRLRAWAMDRRHWGDIAQVDSLRYLVAKNRRRAWRAALQSIILWPPMVIQRRTLGLVRRILTGVSGA